MKMKINGLIGSHERKVLCIGFKCRLIKRFKWRLKSPFLPLFLPLVNSWLCVPVFWLQFQNLYFGKSRLRCYWDPIPWVASVPSPSDETPSSAWLQSSWGTWGLSTAETEGMIPGGQTQQISATPNHNFCWKYVPLGLKNWIRKASKYTPLVWVSSPLCDSCAPSLGTFLHLAKENHCH